MGRFRRGTVDQSAAHINHDAAALVHTDLVHTDHWASQPRTTVTETSSTGTATTPQEESRSDVKQQAVQYWNRIAASSDADARDAVLWRFRSERAFDEAGREDAAHLILPFVSEGDTVLDVGCGLGRLLKWAAGSCKRAIGVDVSKEMLEKARKRLSGLRNVELKRLPLSLRFPLSPKSVDFAYFYHVSEHLDREDTFRILREMKRCLRPAGRCLVQFALLDHPDNQLEFRTWAREGDDEGVRSRFYSDAEALTLLSMAGLYPQLRLYIPGEFVVVVTGTDARVLGEMPLVRLVRDRGNGTTTTSGRRRSGSAGVPALLPGHIPPPRREARNRGRGRRDGR